MTDAGPARVRTEEHDLDSGEHGSPGEVLAAGLPDAPKTITGIVTFGERLAYRPLRPLRQEAVEIALIRPARTVGGHWTPSAINRLLVRTVFQLGLVVASLLCLERPQQSSTDPRDRFIVGCASGGGVSRPAAYCWSACRREAAPARAVR